jgi:ribonuclease HI
VPDEVRLEWDNAQLCLKACGKLGRSAQTILSIAQLKGNQTRWKCPEELVHRQCHGCHLTTSEYAALTSWLAASGDDGRSESVAPVGSPENEALLASATGKVVNETLTSWSQHQRRPSAYDCATAAASAECPPFIGGKIIGAPHHDQLVLCSTPLDRLPDVDISSLSDPVLLDFLCGVRAVFPFSRNGTDTLLIECLMSLRRVVSPYPFKQEYLLARSFTAGDSTPLTVLQVALVRDCLLGADRERLREACARPCWTVTRDEYYAGPFLSVSNKSGAAPIWQLQTRGSTGQMKLPNLVQHIIPRRCNVTPSPVIPLHPWQVDPPLPSQVVIDISHHLPRSLQAPEGREVLQRNGRIWITERSNSVIRLDAAHYGMLLASCCGCEEQQVPTVQFLMKLGQSCRAQQVADLQHYVHWSRHLLANIREITGVDLLVGASAVTFNPHFPHFISPYLPDVHLGAAACWPQVPALLILDSFAPLLRQQVLTQAAAHSPGVWVLWQHKNNPDDSCLAALRQTARLYAELPKKSMILHKAECWETAAWDVEQSWCLTQLWRLEPCAGSLVRDSDLSPETVQQHLCRGGYHQYAFHWCEDPVPPRLLLYRQNQQDALLHSWDGLVAGTDGSVDLRAERMGAAYVLGADRVPIMVLSVRVGGPLASARAEAASLLQLLRDVRSRYGHHVNLLIFVDCLVILDILRKWGRSEFHPGPRDVIHFDILSPLIDELRQWVGNIRLLKVKSHSGCLLNERADELAELGRGAEGPEICPGPQKYGSFWLRLRQETRKLAGDCGKLLPRDSAPNSSLLEKVAVSNTLRAVRHRGTAFVTALFDQKEGLSVSRIIRRCTPAEYRVWLKCMTGTYPVQLYLKRITLASSSICPHCDAGTPESLTHFACVCPKFREARTSAHNQVRNVITAFLESAIGPEWRVLTETRMVDTGLVLCSHPQTVPVQVNRWQPDWTLISKHHKRIAIVDLCRPSDVHPTQLLAAALRKQRKYSPLLEALCQYTEQGWTVHVFPWVVGIRGMIDPLHVASLLQYLCVPRQKWQAAVDLTVLASVTPYLLPKMNL